MPVRGNAFGNSMRASNSLDNSVLVRKLLGEFRKWNPALAIRPDSDQHGIERGSRDGQFGAGVEMTERSTDRAAVARLLMPDVTQGGRDQWTATRHNFGTLKRTLRRHCPNAQHMFALGNPDDLGDAAKVDQMIGRNDTKIHHRHQRLATRDRARIL